MLDLLILAIKVGLIVAAFIGARRFVRDRLRFVDGAQNKVVPWIVGGIAALIALPVAAVLPLVGTWTAIAFGAGVGVGVASGARDIRRGTIGELPSGS